MIETAGSRGREVLYHLAMAIFHVSTSTPTKAELLREWAPTQPWYPNVAGEIQSVGSFHFDDPEGKVGMETHIVDVAGVLLQIPLTYRDAPVHERDDALVGTLEHSVLGTRYIYDGLRDDCHLMTLAGVALTGQGHALGMAEFDGRWYASPENVRLDGGGWTAGPVAVDGFEMISDNSDDVVFENDRFELEIQRRLRPGPRPPIGLVARWAEQPVSVVIARIEDRRAFSTAS